MVDKEIVVGALIDFVGSLTTSEKEIVVGAMHPVYDLHDALMVFCGKRQLDMRNAKVEGWLEELNKLK